MLRHYWVAVSSQPHIHVLLSQLYADEMLGQAGGFRPRLANQVVLHQGWTSFGGAKVWAGSFRAEERSQEAKVLGPSPYWSWTQRNRDPNGSHQNIANWRKQGIVRCTNHHPFPFSSLVTPGKSKTLKKYFLPERVKTKREGIVWKISKINAKHDYNIS
jgi:hypothetical protein